MLVMSPRADAQDRGVRPVSQRCRFGGLWIERVRRRGRLVRLQGLGCGHA
jgi:hypothetical protein